MSELKNIIGQTFGNLKVIARDENSHNGKAMWICECKCGNIVSVYGTYLRNGHTKSCGCLVGQKAIQRSTIHGMTRTSIHNVWKTMKQRCFNPKNHKYRIYGERGITVCDEWKNDFRAFYEFVSKLPHFGEKGYSIDRIDVNGNYEPGNVRWATAKEQQLNRRKKAS